MPVGLLVTLVLLGLGTALSLWPAFRSGPGGALTWLLSAVPNESPSLAILWFGAAVLLSVSEGHVRGVGVWVALGMFGASVAAAPILLRRALRAGPAIEAALERGLGDSWRSASDVRSIASTLPWRRILFAPLPLFHPGVKRVANLSYGDAGRRNRLDLYKPRAARRGQPVLIHLHGGGSSLAPGRKSFYARSLLFGLARRGWVCISANYRLSPAARFPDDLVDVKKLIVWARAHAHEHGGDPDRIVLAGSSYGARLATLAGFTTGVLESESGLERADTSVAAVVGLYGYYGETASRESLPSSPFDYVVRGAPPLLIVHGDQDTLTPCTTARALAERARNASANPALYVELPGAQHSFDLFTSVRMAAITDGIQTFAAAALSRTDASLAPRAPSRA